MVFRVLGGPIGRSYRILKISVCVTKCAWIADLSTGSKPLRAKRDKVRVAKSDLSTAFERLRAKCHQVPAPSDLIFRGYRRGK